MPPAFFPRRPNIPFAKSGARCRPSATGNRQYAEHRLSPNRQGKQNEQNGQDEQNKQKSGRFLRRATPRVRNRLQPAGPGSNKPEPQNQGAKPERKTESTKPGSTTVSAKPGHKTVSAQPRCKTVPAKPERKTVSAKPERTTESTKPGCKTDLQNLPYKNRDSRDLFRIADVPGGGSGNRGIGESGDRGIGRGSADNRLRCAGIRAPRPDSANLQIHTALTTLTALTAPFGRTLYRGSHLHT